MFNDMDSEHKVWAIVGPVLIICIMLVMIKGCEIVEHSVIERTKIRAKSEQVILEKLGEGSTFELKNRVIITTPDNRQYESDHVTITITNPRCH
jgi:hypothetical protein